MNAHTIVIGVVIIVLLYLLYLYFFGNGSAVLVGIHDASQEIKISPSSIAPGPTQNFTYISVLCYRHAAADAAAAAGPAQGFTE